MAKWRPDGGRAAASVGEVESYWVATHLGEIFFAAPTADTVTQALVEIGELVMTGTRAVRPRVGSTWVDVAEIVRLAAVAARVGSEHRVTALDVAHAVLAYPGRRSAP